MIKYIELEFLDSHNTQG